ncbi:unnamed protein product [Fusarium graminearum]|nr:unnamed protein product [Fusarium graminearum]
MVLITNKLVAQSRHLLPRLRSGAGDSSHTARVGGCLLIQQLISHSRLTSQHVPRWVLCCAVSHASCEQGRKLASATPQPSCDLLHYPILSVLGILFYEHGISRSEGPNIARTGVSTKTKYLLKAAAVLQSQQHGALCRLWIPSPCNAAIERPGGQSSGPVMVRNGKATGSRLATAARMCTWRLGSLPH